MDQKVISIKTQEELSDNESIPKISHKINLSNIPDKSEEKKEDLDLKENTENQKVFPSNTWTITEDEKNDIKRKNEEHSEENDENNNEGNNYANSRSRSRSESRERERKRSFEHKYKFYVILFFFARFKKNAKKKCCDKCKKNDKNGKTCVCVVPANQRKVHIGSAGCKTCGCKGCTKEDMKEREELMRNGCCKKCMKAFSKNQKACLCQVPKAVRKQPLPPEGCNYCGCLGCNPEDTRFSKKRHGNRSSSRRRSVYKHQKRNFRDRDDYSSKSEESGSEEEHTNIDDLNLNNFDKSSIGGFITNTLNIFPPLIGFGIPQRTANYILGKPLNQ